VIDNNLSTYVGVVLSNLKLTGVCRSHYIKPAVRSIEVI